MWVYFSFQPGAPQSLLEFAWNTCDITRHGALNVPRHALVLKRIAWDRRAADRVCYPLKRQEVWQLIYYNYPVLFDPAVEPALLRPKRLKCRSEEKCREDLNRGQLHHFVFMVVTVANGGQPPRYGYMQKVRAMYHNPLAVATPRPALEIGRLSG